MAVLPKLKEPAGFGAAAAGAGVPKEKPPPGAAGAEPGSPKPAAGGAEAAGFWAPKVKPPVEAWPKLNPPLIFTPQKIK